MVAGHRYKLKRNERIVYISQYLVDRPSQLVNYQTFMAHLNCAKTSVSEDLSLIKLVFEQQRLGTIKTFPGASGGVVYYPIVHPEEQRQIGEKLMEMLSKGHRILQGNYIYLGDILQNPNIVDRIARLMASRYIYEQVDAVMTMESNGIGLATLVARYLDAKFIFARTGKTTSREATRSVEFVSGSYHKVGRMELEESQLEAKERVLIVDDFIRNGGTCQGMIDLVKAFDAKLVRVCVVGENPAPDIVRTLAFDSLVSINLAFNEESRQYELELALGSLFEKKSEPTID